MSKRIILLMIAVMLFSGIPTHAGAAERIGIDTDLIAYRIGKFPQSVFLSGWYSWERWKFSATFAYLELVDAHAHDGFVDDVATVYGLGADYTFNNNLSGFSVGPRVIYIDGSATSQKNQQRGKYYSLNAGFNLGFIWKITRNLYVLPNVNILFPIGEKEYVIGDDIYENTWNFEPGLRIGWEF